MTYGLAWNIEKNIYCRTSNKSNVGIRVTEQNVDVTCPDNIEMIELT